MTIDGKGTARIKPADSPIDVIVFAKDSNIVWLYVSDQNFATMSPEDLHASREDADNLIYDLKEVGVMAYEGFSKERPYAYVHKISPDRIAEVLERLEYITCEEKEAITKDYLLQKFTNIEQGIGREGMVH